LPFAVADHTTGVSLKLVVAWLLALLLALLAGEAAGALHAHGAGSKSVVERGEAGAAVADPDSEPAGAVVSPVGTTARVPHSSPPHRRTMVRILGALLITFAAALPAAAQMNTGAGHFDGYCIVV
jgi:hypothetical protein